ncbi:polyribonucleotide nucleotidyltransferase [Candidatus Campbellbacteria bacterium RIFOXYC2_FULL_35_25]|uniref:Polyribonucleotide nucleotidyltransferase n=1 Tax=Candidatus Campbellbacteria bacterium RIFOXYC2_FULL_35_25 TaxID=1797582 RepID=A0A1F5EHY1_9BACT|nr:MAG: polyribonucleotide nucleotidyltransferase [Candidatus Campbellbacteria bacterium RIFOXYC2_FULL_35_25]
MIKKEYSMEIGGQTLTAQFNDLADQANGSVMLSCGDTTILATAVMSSNVREGGDWFPLTVDYEEKFYAAGQILGSRFMRREGRASDEATLGARVVDRTIRPLFEQHIRNEIQVIITILSLGDYDPDILAITAASLALATSDIPWNGPVSAVRIAKNGEYKINPNYLFKNNDDLELDLVACGKDGNINMIEVGSKETSEDVVNEGLKMASQEIEKIQEFQKKIIAEIGKKKQVIVKPNLSSETVELFKKEITPKLEGAVFSGPGKKGIEGLKDEWKKLFKEQSTEESISLALDHYEEAVNDLIHKEAIENNRRVDGRKMDEVRNLFAQAGGVSKKIHGSGIFYRGGTHVFSALTLGGPKDAQLIDGMEEKMEKKFMHHYNFPPFSTGETGRMGGTNRRMIGHGALAEKALLAVIPSKENFPYTIRIVSESMASNGSTSMASVCGSTLALMDGGVPIKAPVAGIASGLMMLSESNYKLLTDIQGPEDYHGDMDFKVAGTRNGITAIQMDVKVGGIPLKILSEALEAAKKARLEILDVIEKEIAKPRTNISPNAPEILIIKIKQDQIGLVIGGGGKTIKEIKEKTGAEIDIEDDGTVFITGKNGSAQEAKKIVGEMTRDFLVGEKFEGEVIKVLDFGAFVKIAPNKEGLVHISEIAPFRIEKMEGILKEGQKVPVIIKEIDAQERIKLSIKDIDPNFVKKPE